MKKFKAVPKNKIFASISDYEFGWTSDYDPDTDSRIWDYSCPDCDTFGSVYFLDDDYLDNTTKQGYVGHVWAYDSNADLVDVLDRTFYFDGYDSTRALMQAKKWVEQEIRKSFNSVKTSADIAYKKSIEAENKLNEGVKLHIHYPRSGFGSGFQLKSFFVDYDEFLNNFGPIFGDRNSKYATFLRMSDIGHTYYDLAYLSNDLEKCVKVAKDYLDERYPENGVYTFHRYVNIVDTETGEELYYADVFEDLGTGWAYNL